MFISHDEAPNPCFVMVRLAGLFAQNGGPLGSALQNSRHVLNAALAEQECRDQAHPVAN